MTKQEAIENHRKMWYWIAIRTMRTKKKILKVEYFLTTLFCAGAAPVNDCYCCEYAEQYNNKEPYMCKRCPIDWFSKTTIIPCCNKEKARDEKGLFYLWKLEKDYKKAALLAYKISKLPERK